MSKGAGIELKDFYIRDLGADSFKEYHLLVTPTADGGQEFLVIGKSSSKLKIGDTILLTVL
ncbi:hypothetical protein FC81_GL000491 [Liquorilactobacillus capillatus DSM 19910]|uniref:Uncharacterized protein n=1 Tax=Liquorilactobacillus capillatus DSM 19910 TaxID=1423731 RepID=A0A0R1M4Z3_9LACO|nr:hypothetical protein FC81_GL000491 [Liquorilactobacillus capillatus DSM 19910]